MLRLLPSLKRASTFATCTKCKNVCRPRYRLVQTLTSVKTQGNISDLDLDDYKRVFASRSLWEILRALLVFKVCSYDVIVANSLKLMETSKKILGTRLYEKLMYMTIYGQFVGGATKDQIQRRVQTLNNIGVGAILFIPIEEAIGDYRDPDEIYSNNLQKVKQCLHLAKSLDKAHPIAQLKLMSLVPVELCKTLSKKIPDPQTQSKHIEAMADALDGKDLVLGDLLSKEDTTVMSKSLARIKDVCELAESLGVYIWVDAEYTYLNPALRLISLAMMLKSNRTRPIIAYTYQNYLKLAESLGVYIWVDAEYTYLNPALRLISLATMLKSNRTRPIIAYTTHS